MDVVTLRDAFPLPKFLLQVSIRRVASVREAAGKDFDLWNHGSYS
jgi:hypothetical protein